MTSMRTLFHIPFPPTIGKNAARLNKLATDAGCLDENFENTLLLFKDPSAFRSEMYLSVTDVVPGANNIEITGEFISRVFEGNYNDVPKFLKEFNLYLNSIEKTAIDFYIHYAYCPKCSKKYGNNRILILAKI